MYWCFWSVTSRLYLSSLISEKCLKNSCAFSASCGPVKWSIFPFLRRAARIFFFSCLFPPFWRKFEILKILRFRLLKPLFWIRSRVLNRSHRRFLALFFFRFSPILDRFPLFSFKSQLRFSRLQLLISRRDLLISQNFPVFDSFFQIFEIFFVLFSLFEMLVLNFTK